MITFDVTEDDQRAWMQFVIDEQGRVGALRLAFSMLVVLIGAIFGMAVADFTGLAMGAGAGGVLAVTVVPAALRRSVRSQIDQAIASAPDGSLGRITLELTTDRITYTTSAAHATWSRNAIRRVAVRGDHAFIMFGPSNGLVVPLRDHTGDRHRFIDALNRGSVPTDDSSPSRHGD
jgi:hypothetical protein